MNAPTPGSVVGVQVPTTDLDRSITFYNQVFGWEFTEDAHIETIRHADTDFAFSLSPVHGPHRPGGSFLNVSVADLRGALARAAELGSQILIQPTTTPFGTIAMIDDPSGALLLLVESP